MQQVFLSRILLYILIETMRLLGSVGICLPTDERNEDTKETYVYVAYFAYIWLESMVHEAVHILCVSADLI